MVEVTGDKKVDLSSGVFDQGAKAGCALDSYDLTSVLDGSGKVLTSSLW